MTPWQWKRFACGLWTEGEEPWIRPELWDILKDPGLELDMDEPVWVGVDVGVRNDSTAVVTVAAREGGTVAVKARVLKPGVEGIALETVGCCPRGEGRNARGAV
jgi:hypothetical protein